MPPARPQRALRALLPALLVPGLILACLSAPVPAATEPPPTLPPFTATPLPPTPPPTPTLPPTLAPSPTPGPTPQPVFGLELSALEPAYGLGLVGDLGVYWARRAGVWWPDVEAQEGRREWEALASMEQEFSDASAQGLHAVLVVRGAPEWAQAQPGVACGPIRQDRLEAFGAFVGELVARYSGPPYNVRYWEIGNEPDIAPALVPPDNLFGCWGDQDDPYYGGGYYAEALKAVYPRVKAANPEALVLTGGLLLDCNPVNPPPDRDCTPARFLEGVLLNDGAAYFDGVSFHAYDYYGGSLGAYGHPGWDSRAATTGPVALAKAAYLRDLLAAHGAADKFLMNTEAAVICGRTGDEPQCLAPEAVETKSYYVAQSYAAALAAGLRANVWYSLTGWRASGLTDVNLNPLPAYAAYRFAATELRSVVYSRDLAEFPGVRGYEFLRDGGRVWLLWSPDAEQRAVTLPATPAGVFDVYGQPLPPTETLNVGAAPLYLSWPPAE